MLEIVLVALSLSMDAFAVSVSSAACSRRLTNFHMLRAATAFGVFQFAMPLAGALIGATFNSLIGSFDHWIAFLLLSLVGIKMLHEVYEEWKESPDGCACPSGEEEKKKDLRSKRVTLLLAIATSIDALAVGMSYAVVGKPALVPAIFIGVVTFAVCAAGFHFGRKIGCLFGRWAQLAGGVTLIVIGGRILFSHLSGAT